MFYRVGGHFHCSIRKERGGYSNQLNRIENVLNREKMGKSDRSIARTVFVFGIYSCNLNKFSGQKWLLVVLAGSFERKKWSGGVVWL